jgi:hypothetical protein
MYFTALLYQYLFFILVRMLHITVAFDSQFYVTWYVYEMRRNALFDCLGKQQYIVGKNNILLVGFGNNNILLYGFGQQQ